MLYSEITLMDYSTLNLVCDEVVLIDKVIEDIEVYEMDIYDAISEVANDAIPYNEQDLWCGAHLITEELNEVLRGYSYFEDIRDVLIEGYWGYFTGLLNENIVPIKFNMISEMVNNYFKEHNLMVSYDILSEIEMHISYRIAHYETDKIYGLIQVYDEIKDFLEGNGELDV